jgi:hypothetical protein
MENNNRKYGNLYYNAETERIFVRCEEGSEEDLHCGTIMQAMTQGQWMNTRLELSASSEWYLVGLYRPGQIPAGQRVCLDV